MTTSLQTFTVTLLALALWPVILLVYAWRGCLRLAHGAPAPVARVRPLRSTDGVVIDLAAYRQRRGKAA